MSILKSVATVLQGTIAAQVIGFLALPLLTRLFSPEAFGLLQVFQSSLTFLLVIAAMRMEIAILSAADERELAGLTRLCIIINVIATAGVVAVCVALTLMGLPGERSLRGIVWYMPAALLCGGLLQTIGYLALRDRKFKLGAAAKVVQVTSYASSAVGIGTASPLPTGLILADIVGRALAVILYILRLGPRALSVGVPLIDRALLASLWHKYREYPYVSVPGGLINAAGAMLTPILLYGTFSAATSGQFALAERGIGAPVAMLSIAVSQVFMADFSLRLRTSRDEALLFYRQLVWTLLKWAAVPAIVGAAPAPSLFAAAFGPAWRVAGEFAQLMVPLYLVTFVAGTVNMTILLLGQQRLQMAWEFTRLLALGVTWTLIAKLDFGARTAIGLHMIVSTALYVAYLVLADVAIRRGKQADVPIAKAM